MTTIGLSYSLVKISTKCAPALIGRVQHHFRQLFQRLPVADPIIAPVDIEID
ncbi:hypothetical protein ACEUDR_20480 [Aeromonas veronii]